MKTILIHSEVKEVDQFCEILSSNLEGFKIVTSEEEVKLEDVEVAIIWLNVPKYLDQLINLKLLLICGSGIDHIINSPELSSHVPTIRLVDPYLRNRVTNYVVEHVLKQFYPSLAPAFQEKDLKEELRKLKKPNVGIMGLGMIGAFMAEKLNEIGFDVCGWVRSFRPRIIEEVYVGDEALKGFAQNCEVLVCQLPLTKATYKILNQRLFDLLPNEAYVINVGRGSHLEEEDLLLALDSGKLSGACLDVFEVEPLPSDHVFHSNSKITVTPHIAGYIGADTQAPYAARVILDFYQNKKIVGLVDYQAQY